MADKRQSTQVVPQHDHHGNSVAAWATVIIMMVGFGVLTVGWVQKNDLVLYGIGAALIVVGAVVGKVLAMMGMGIKHD